MSLAMLIVAFFINISLIAFCAWQSNRKRELMDVSMIPWNGLMMLLLMILVVLIGYVLKSATQ